MRVKYAGLHVLTAPLSGKLYLIHCRYNGQHSTMLVAQTEIEIMSYSADSKSYYNLAFVTALSGIL